MSRPITETEGQSIVTFLRDRLDQRIDRGECWDAAERGIQSVGAARPNSSQLYVWGTSVTRDELRIGDVVQFSSFTVKVTQSDGSWVSYQLGSPRHTAVIASINSDGSVNLIHQNFGEAGRVVSTLNNVYLSGSTSGGTTVTTTGTVRMYRPQVP
jgi:hypothetical protein